MLNIVELFAGIGAQARALENLNIEFQSIVSEIDNAAWLSYQNIHPYTKAFNVGDIREVDWIPDDVDLMTYSFPCQDLSIMGQHNGMIEGSGTRSGLLWEVKRILENNDKPKVLLMENVPAVRHKRNIAEFERWCSFLESLGYHNSWKVLNAKDYGIPQNRNRLFMVSTLDREFRFSSPNIKMRLLEDFLTKNPDHKYWLTPQRVLSNIEHKKRNEELGRGFGWEPIHYYDIAHTILTSPHKSASNFLYDEEGGYRMLTPGECWALMGFNKDDCHKCWCAGVSETNLYKQAGNSIVVPVLESIFKDLIKQGFL